MKNNSKSCGTAVWRHTRKAKKECAINARVTVADLLAAVGAGCEVEDLYYRFMANLLAAVV